MNDKKTSRKDVRTRPFSGGISAEREKSVKNPFSSLPSVPVIAARINGPPAARPEKGRKRAEAVRRRIQTSSYLCPINSSNMTKLSVNINKIATLRNSRGGTLPDVTRAAIDCQRFGADGITVHLRPDERHIRYSDVFSIKKIITTEFNIEGYPSDGFIRLVSEVIPEQVTLVPDPPEAITSNSGWDTVTHRSFLRETVSEFRRRGIRVSIFVDPVEKMVPHAAECGADRIEMYTEPYASNYEADRARAVAPFVKAAEEAVRCGLGINAGHDLSLQNLRYFSDNIPSLLEVSIGHALIADALYFGLENTIRLYKREIKR